MITELRSSLSSLPTQIKTEETTGFPNVAADHMRHELFKQQIEVRELAVKLGEEHPLVKTAMDQVKESEVILNQQAPERVQTTMAANPERQALQLDLAREEVLAASWRGKLKTVNGQLAAMSQRIEALNGQEVAIGELERDITIQEANHRMYAEHLEQARIAATLEENQVSNVNVIQQPSLIETPASPPVRLMLAVGFLAAIAGALGIGLVAEWFDTSLKSARDVESHLAIPVLITLPRVAREHVIPTC